MITYMESTGKENVDMYCKNCGAALEEHAELCPGCGCGKGMGRYYCANCGQPVIPGAPTCARCGHVNQSAPVATNTKSKVVAALLAFFLGYFGVHNFYLGYTGKAIAQLLVTLLSCCMLFFVSGIWGIVDGILILTGKIAVDAKGNPLGE